MTWCFRVTRLAVVFVFLVSTSQTSFAEERPHWIPVGTVSPELEHRAMQQRVLLQHHSRDVQRAGLQSIRSSINRFGRGDLRIAAVPLVVDMLGMEYHLLSVSSSYIVDSPTRMEALELLADIGGAQARSQLRESIIIDQDGTVRASAALLLSQSPGASPDEDLAAVSRALRAAVDRGNPEEEVRRLLSAAMIFSRRAWTPDHPDLLRSLGAIVSGPYSSSLRRTAFSLFEELARR